MMKRLSYYIMLLGIVFFTSCEDFLDQVPKHNLTLDNAVTDYSGAKNILNGMYSIVASNSACLHKEDFTLHIRLILIWFIKKGLMTWMGLGRLYTLW